MSRSINESITQLETSLSDIKTSLTNKKVEMGGVEQLKVSEVSGYIDQIKSGGGGLNLIEDVTWEYRENPESSFVYYDSYFDPDGGSTGLSVNLTAKIKEENISLILLGSTNNLQIEPKKEFIDGETYNIGDIVTISGKTGGGSWGAIIFTKSVKGEVNLNPDIFVFNSVM